MRVLALALMGFFLCLNVNAAELRPLNVGPMTARVVCTVQVEDLLHNLLKVEGYKIVWSGINQRGTVIRVFENPVKGKWQIVHFVGKDFACLHGAGSRGNPA
jgi:hypothetical protein